MPLPHRRNRQQAAHDRAVAYCCAAPGEVVVDLAHQEARCREDAARHDSRVVMVVQEELRGPAVPPLRRAGLLGAIVKVRKLGGRGVLLAISPTRFGGSIFDLALLCALVDSGGGAVATVEAMVNDQVDQLRLFRMAEMLTAYGEMLDEMRRQDDADLLRGSLAWPPSGDTDPAR